MRLWLPFPPNTNNLFANGSRGRFPTPRYKAWTVAATEALSRQRVRRVKGRYRLVLIFDRPDRRKRDLDGVLKAPIDILVKAGVTPDDSLCSRIVASWASDEPVKDAQVTIIISEVM